MGDPGAQPVRAALAMASRLVAVVGLAMGMPQFIVFAMVKFFLF
jgi:hypothetical protein